MMTPVSPSTPPASFSSPGEGDGDDEASGSDNIGDPELVDMKDALPSEPIVGVERVIMDQHGPGAVAPKALSSPQGMTAAQWEKHKLAHLPLPSWMPYLQGYAHTKCHASPFP